MPPSTPGIPGQKLPPLPPERRHPAAEPDSGETTLQSAHVEETTPVSGHDPAPRPRRVQVDYPSTLDTSKGLGPEPTRSLSPPPISNPAPVSLPLTSTERDLVLERARRKEAEARARTAEQAAQSAVRGPRWWESGEEVRKTILVLAGLGLLGGGGAVGAAVAKKTEVAPVVAPDPCPLDIPDPKRPAVWPNICFELEALKKSVSSGAAELGTVKTAVGDLRGHVSAVEERLPVVKQPAIVVKPQH